MTDMNNDSTTTQKSAEKPKGWFRRQYDGLRNWYYQDDNFLRRVRFPGTKLPLLDVILDFIKLFTKGRTLDRAAGVAFNFILAVFPLILFFFTLIPYIPIPHLYDRVMMMLNGFLLPSGTLDYVTETIDGILNQPHEGVLSASIILCLVFGSSGMVAFFNGFRNVYAGYVNSKGLTLKNWLIQRLFAILMLLIFGVLILISVLLISLGGEILKVLVDHQIIEFHGSLFTFFNVLRWVVGIFGLCFGLSLLYYFGNVKFKEHYRKERRKPTASGKKYRELVIFSPGTILATSLFVVATLGFNIYISNFSRYNALYGSIGTLIIVMLWIWIISILILAGNDLNSGIRRASYKKSSMEEATMRQQIVIDDLSKNIQRYQVQNERLQQKIATMKKTIEDETLVIESLMEEAKAQEIVIKAYQRFADEELKKGNKEEMEDIDQ